MLISYFISLLVIFICVVVAAVLTVVFRGEIETTMRNAMKETLLDKYGYDLDNNEENVLVTDSWDETQSRFSCCAVDDGAEWDFRNYRLSNWFERGQANVLAKDRNYVPASCCATRFSQTENMYMHTSLAQCQRPVYGPPRHPDTTNWGKNDDLNHQGCYTIGYDLVMGQAGVLTGLAFASAILLVSGMVFSMCLYRYIPTPESDRRKHDY